MNILIDTHEALCSSFLVLEESHQADILNSEGTSAPFAVPGPESGLIAVCRPGKVERGIRLPSIEVG
eukprot:CAMPEP_0114537716 /NCGR_PEP_ID=MMETSP0109-20121206/29729_1 /TAXON_ID=29199 /ORGANISM="Chlorarachnion reptans, Strain CCCM449" /LENGTH=66 /DNA_ID=CAMNT_0001721629 /DNA_START=284 /DNA_END=484 /DNA_ORIENTATION=-